MTTPHKISQWLEGTPPEAFEVPALQALVEKYPYFWPAGLLRINIHDDGLDYSTLGNLRALYAPAPVRVMVERAWIQSEDAFQLSSGDEPTFDEQPEEQPTPFAEPDSNTLSTTDATISHGLEHDPLEDAVASTFSAEEGGSSHNAAIVDAPENFDASDTTPAAKDAQHPAESLPQPLYTLDYFSHQGVAVDADLPDVVPVKNPPVAKTENEEDDADRGLMVMRSFSDWMTYFQRSAQEAQEEEESKRAVRAMWQKEKLAAALEEEEEEIPDDVFRMAVASIAPDGVVSEPLAEILAGQGKWARAIDMYRKLATKEPSKSAYFARKIEALEARNTAQ